MTNATLSPVDPAQSTPVASSGLWDIEALYAKYHDELVELGGKLQRQYYQMQRQYQGMATFGDAEGEVLYMLIREERPGVVFEISPCSGWSSNYSLAALTRNAHGTLHSFEIQETFLGRPAEEVIRGNIHPDADQKRFVVHIGDARETTKAVPGTIDFLLIDSLHTDAFAQWYISEIFSRVDGGIMVQDIAFHDLLEKSSEATYLWRWLREKHIDFALVNDTEERIRQSMPALRADIPERRGLRSNSIVLRRPYVQQTKPKVLQMSPEKMIGEAEERLRAGDTVAAQRLITVALRTLVGDPTRTNRHRPLMKAASLLRRFGNPDEADRCTQRSFGIVLQGDAQQRKKGLVELWFLLLRQHRIGLLLHVSVLVLLWPTAWRFWGKRLVMTAGFRRGA